MITSPQNLNELILNIPIYQSLYGAKLRDFDFEKNRLSFPRLEKQHIVEGFPKNWNTPDLENAITNGELEYGSSSGTSGNQTLIIRKKGWWQEEYNEVYKWDSSLTKLIDSDLRKAVLTMPCCANSDLDLHDELLGYCERELENTLHLNMSYTPNLWRNASMRRMLKELRKYAPFYFQADPVYLMFLLKYLKNHEGMASPMIFQPKLLGFGYEYLTKNTKKFIESYFPNIRQINIYGTRETGLNLFTSESKIKPINSRCIIDFDHLEGNIFRLVVTSWKNEFMPLINYITGDLVRLDSEGEILQFCGRESESLVNAAGKLITVGDLDNTVSKVDSPIIFYQLFVESDNVTDFKYITASDEPISEQCSKEINEAISSLLKKGQSIKFALDDKLAPQQSGKFAIIKRESKHT